MSNIIKTPQEKKERSSAQEGALAKALRENIAKRKAQKHARLEEKNVEIKR